MTHKWLAAALSLALVATLTPDFAEAKRLGGGKSFGMQRQAPAKPAPTGTPPSPAQQATPGQTSPTAAPATAGATAAAAAAPARRSWMGPIAGLAAGLGLAALASHFGFGEGLANFMMIALLAIAAVFLVRFVMARMGGSRRQPAMAGAAAAGAGNGPTPLRVEPQMPVQRSAMPTAPVAPATGGEVSVTGVPLAPMAGGLAAATAVATEDAAAMKLPEGFDLPAFERVAKMIFIRLQAANDTADLDDLREFTTPEMYAAIRLELQERGGVAQQTDVERVDAELIDFVTEPTRQVASVRFHGLIREELGAQAEAFDEVWHLVKPADGSRTWAISGIQQAH